MEAVASAISASDLLEKRVRGQVDRYKKFSKNPALVDTLVETVTKLKQQLRLLEGKCKQLGSKLSSEWDNGILSARSATVSDNLKSIEDRLEKEGEQSKECGKCRDILHRYGRAKSTCQMLTECGADARAVEKDVVEIYSLAVQAEQVVLAQQGNSTQEEILNRIAPAAEHDMFRACFDVEENPCHVVLHYGPMPRGGEEDDGATMSPEAQLKCAVLGASEAHDITAAVGSLGMGGVGKSCALRGLAADEDVRRRFPDGVYMMVLGEKASKVDVVKGLSDMVKRSGGRKVAQDMRKERGDVREALSQARVWFRSRRILLLVDDVWDNGEVKSSIIRQLHGSVVGGQSRLAFTTRHARLASEYQAVKFSERDEVASREMLLRAAGAREGSTDSFEDVVDGLLKLSAGLPLALAIVGKDIAARFRYSGGRSWGKAWAETLTAISSRRNRLVEGSDCDYDKHSLEAVLESSLETLENGRRRRLGFEPKMSVHEMYRSLVVQKKQAALPVGVLRRLWGMDDEHDALEAMHMFVEVSMAERRGVTLNEKDIACLSLHDLQRDFVQAKCKERGEEEKHHRKVLDGWWDGSRPSREVGGETSRDWSGSEAFDDEYMRNNLARHLVGAGLGSELRGLLRNPRWTAERLRKREVLGLEKDFGLAMASLEGEGGVEKGRGSGERERWGLEMICGAARLSSFYANRNPGEVWFQLRGRLVGLAEKSCVIREFVGEIDRYAERPWARPTWACLSEPGGRLLSTVQCAGPVLGMQRGGREGEMRVCGVEDGMGFICSVVNGEMEGEEVYLNKRAERECECGRLGAGKDVGESEPDRSVCSGCSRSCVDVSAGAEWSAVVSVRYTADGGRVVTRHRNGTIRMWDGASGKAIGGTFEGYGKRCDWSADGSRVVCGGTDGNVRMWDVVSGEAAGGVERAHSDGVSCVDCSADGSRVVSGGWDGSVTIWDGVSGKVVGGDKRAHGGEVELVKWSVDGSRVVSGGGDGSVRIWDGASGEAVGGDADAHDGWGVKCIEWSSDGSRVVSVGGDTFVKIWDGASGEVVDGDERADEGGVSCIKWSPDGSRFASGEWCGSVRTWDGASGEVVGGGDVTLGEDVDCLEWSADGAWFVSGGSDGVLRMWDGGSGEVVSRDELAHGRGVGHIEWSADGSRVVYGGSDGSVRMWDGASGEVVGGDEHAHSQWVSCIKWSADGGRILSGARNGSVRIWDGASGEAVGGDADAHGGDQVTVTEWSADGSRVVSGGGDGSVKIWDGASGEAVGGDDHAHSEEGIGIDWSADGSRFLSKGSGGSVRIWDGASGEAVGGDANAHGDRRVSVTEWSPDGSRVVSGGEDGSVRVWDGASGEAVGGDEHAHDGMVTCFQWSADGSRFVSKGHDGRVTIWDGASGEAVGGDANAHGDKGVSVIQWSQDWSRVVCGGGDGSVTIWDGATGEAVGGDADAHGDKGVSVIQWSQDGSRILSGGRDGCVRIWDGASGEAVGGDADAHGGNEVSVIEWSPDESRVLSGGDDGSVRIWDGASGEAVGGDKSAHSGRLWVVKWSPDGDRVVSGGVDGSVRIWDGASGEAVGGHEYAHDGAVRRVEWLSDGDRVVSSGPGGNVRMWDGASGEAIDTELEVRETRPGLVNAAGLTSARDYGGEQVTRQSGEEYKGGRWIASGRSLELWCGGRKVLLATFEAEHEELSSAEFRNRNGAVAFGFLRDHSMYRVEIVK